MSIQFACPSCRNPIEVDDAWASGNVACPYCRNTVLAPATSTYLHSGEIPQACEISHPGAASAGRNVVAIVALALSCLWVAGFVSAMAIVATPLQEALGDNPTAEQLQSFLQEQANAASPASWIVSFGVAFMVAGAAWIAGLVCAIIGVSQRRRRGFAIAAFAVLSAGPILFCAGLVLGP